MKVSQIAQAGGDGSKPVMCIAEYDATSEVFKAILDKHLCVDLTIAGLWPTSTVDKGSGAKAKGLGEKHKRLEHMAVELAESLSR